MTSLDSPNLWVLLQKNLPAPLRLCLHPWFLVSLVLHGLWLLIPMPSDPPPVLEIPEEEQVSLTDLPTTSRALPATPPATPSPKPSPVASVNASPQPVAIARPPAATVASIPPVAPVVAPSAAPPSPSPAPTSAIEPVQANPTPSPTTPPTPEASEPTTAWDSFPHPTNTATCEGLEDCWVAPQSRWQELFREFEQSLQAEGYVLNDISEQRLSSTSGRRIFAIEKDNEPQYYLNMVSTPDGIRYLNTEEPLSEAELNELSGF